MKPPKHLRTGELCVGLAGDTLTTDGIGSCVVICMWDRIRKIGSMAHMFLAKDERVGLARVGPEGASPDRAVPCLLHLMLGLGATQRKISVRLVGAGNMFSGVADGSPVDVGRSILSSTLQALVNAGLTVSSQSVGGRFGRSVKFSVGSGLIQIELTNGVQVLL
jgi:chemotaxis protein CheD